MRVGLRLFDGGDDDHTRSTEYKCCWSRRLSGYKNDENSSSMHKHVIQSSNEEDEYDNYECGSCEAE